MLELEQRGKHNIVREADPHWDYPGKPIILGDASKISDSNDIHWTRSGKAVISLPNGEEVMLPPHHQLDLVGQTFEAIEANLQPGTPYEQDLQSEREKYEQARLKADNSINPNKLAYGELVFYPQYPRLAWLAPSHIKKMALLARNEFQLQDPNQEITYEEQRHIFGSQVFGIFGASVASLAAHRLVDTLRPDASGGIKIGDFDVFNDAVRGRRRHSLIAVNNNKAIITAQEMHEADPWLPTWVYPEGIDPYGNFQQFVEGNQDLDEPPINFGVEAIDRVDDKFEISNRLRDARKDVWRISDIGSAFQVEWLPFSRNPNHPLTIGVSDEELKQSLDKAIRNPSKKTWFDFAFNLIGPHWQSVPEFRDFIQDKIRSPFASAIPQLGIASESAASLVALGVSSTLLGWEWPNRYFVDLRTGTLIREWVNVEDNTIKRETVHQNTGFMMIEQIKLLTGKTIDAISCNIRTGNVTRF